MKRKLILMYAALALAVLANVGLWFSARHAQARWLNVPPAPSKNGMLAFALGDSEFAYRFIGVMLQNLGDTGGRWTMLKDYDYAELTKWLYLADALDPRSDFMPFLASYYFASVEPAEHMRPMISYLREVGQSAEGEKWRWLAQAVYLARFRLNDMNLAQTLAFELAANQNPKIPGWARQMPGFILTARGEKEAAYDIMTATLKTEADKLAPQEVNYMRSYICTRILTMAQAAQNPLCRNLPF